MEYVLRTINLIKKYRNNLVVDGVNINIKQGEIYGFIGENGAGKTTIFRMITGLASPTDGSIELFGEHREKKMAILRKRIGALVERPALYIGMTAYENLEACRLQKGIPGRESVEKVLELLKIYDIKDKKVKDFSLGMKQKLGIALALLGDPEFLILDEPINGLDPIGIMEVREALKKLNKERNTTILISSHILRELYEIATSYGILHKGKILEELTSKQLNEKCRRSLSIKVDNLNKALLVLERKLNINNFKVLPDGTIRVYQYVDNPGIISTAIFKEDIVIEQIMPSEENLEDYFKSLIGGTYNNV
ncbi:ATP-binding cassette domain-containing protein [Clostridium aciditolerans]|uniref:ABC transporter ATP-binding protein n=1 Tax=Clostridium aciditolerans TaxID=339861 RepID=A0A934HYH0_9CLOT|nr:ABC transporter ATP-binding protein [Clostridium aciditolerans]